MSTDVPGLVWLVVVKASGRRGREKLLARHTHADGVALAEWWRQRGATVTGPHPMGLLDVPRGFLRCL